jgi:hypothetical protein
VITPSDSSNFEDLTRRIKTGNWNGTDSETSEGRLMRQGHMMRDVEFFQDWFKVKEKVIFWV